MKRTRGESSLSFACRTTRATIETLSCQESEREDGADSLTYAKRARRDGPGRCLRGCSSSCRHLFNWEPTWSPWPPLSIDHLSVHRKSLRNSQAARESRSQNVQTFVHISVVSNNCKELNKRGGVYCKNIRARHRFVFPPFCEACKYNMRPAVEFSLICQVFEKCTFMRYYAALQPFVSLRVARAAIVKADHEGWDCEIFSNQTWPPDQPSTKRRRCETPAALPEVPLQANEG